MTAAREEAFPVKTPNGSRQPRRWLRMDRRRALVQELEPRILLSADLPGLAGVSELTSLYAPAAVEQLEPSAGELASTAVHGAARELYFVDASVANHEQIVSELLARSSVDTRIDVALLDAGRDGLAQIGEVLEGYGGELSAVHLIAHGSERGLQLGSTWLTAESLAPHADAVAG
jgi:hypothetical protein